jgi:hypothetical protein
MSETQNYRNKVVFYHRRETQAIENTNPSPPQLPWQQADGHRTRPKKSPAGPGTRQPSRTDPCSSSPWRTAWSPETATPVPARPRLHCSRGNPLRSGRLRGYVTPILPRIAVSVSRYVSDTPILRYASDTVSVKYRINREIKIIKLNLDTYAILGWYFPILRSPWPLFLESHLHNLKP